MLSAALLAMVGASAYQDAVAAVPVADPTPQPRIVRLSTTEMFRLAEKAAAAGDLEMVETVYAALEHNPDAEVRAEARFRRARQLVQQNRIREAAVLLRRILDEKPDASGVRLQLAQLLQRLGDNDAALRELRAVQSAGLPAEVARLVDRYSEALRASRPIGASLEIAVAPDSNINRATRSDTLGTVFGDFDIEQAGKAKSGTGLSLRGQAYRRIAVGEGENALLVRGGLFADVYGKSRFNDFALDFAAGPELRIGRTRFNLELGATQRWYGQEPFTRSARVGASVTRPLGTRAQVRVSGSAALVDNRMNDLQDGRVYSARLDLERALSPTTGVALNLALDRQSLKDPGYSTRGWRAGLIAWRDVGRTTLTFGGEVGRLNADERLALFPEKRADRYSRFTLGAKFRQLTFGGFAPVARLVIERNHSTIEFYDYSRTRSEMGIVRAF